MTDPFAADEKQEWRNEQADLQEAIQARRADANRVEAGWRQEQEREARDNRDAWIEEQTHAAENMTYAEYVAESEQY